MSEALLCLWPCGNVAVPPQNRTGAHYALSSQQTMLLCYYMPSYYRLYALILRLDDMCAQRTLAYTIAY